MEQPQENAVEEEHDEQYYLDQAIKLSMEPDEVTPGGEPLPEQAVEQPKQQAADLKDLVTSDFMKDIISDMKLDIDAEGMDDILKLAGSKKEDEKKEEKKDEEDPKK
jgi:hypothetical protein